MLNLIIVKTFQIDLLNGDASTLIQNVKVFVLVAILVYTSFYFAF
jgi:hypothetical protein